MSTPAPNNDDLFRQRLEDYREMPSLKVWEGVEAALDQDKKKRRFLFWLWFAGGGSSLAAALLLIPVLTGTGPSSEGSYALARQHVAPTENRVVNLQRHRLVQQKNAEIRNTEIRRPNRGYVSLVELVMIDSVEATQTRPEVLTPKNKNLSDASVATISASTLADMNTAAGNVPPGNASTDRTETEARTSAVPVSLPLSGIETLPVTRTEMPVVPLPGSFSLPVLASRLTPRLQATLTVQGYGGGVAYRRGKKMYDAGASLNEYTALKVTDTATTDRKKFGVYAGAVIKAGLVINRHWYINVGIGYETHYFADRYRFLIPGTGPDLSPADTLGIENGFTTGFTTSTPFGDALIPVENLPQGVINSPPPVLKMNGKLVYQLHQLVLPLDFGYRYGFKRFGIYVGGSAAFHVPLSQKALFYADSGPVRQVKLNPVAPFNFSLGVEPGIEYNFAKRFSLLAGGTFRYQLLNAYQSGQASRPYVLAGHLGLRVSL